MVRLIDADALITDAFDLMDRNELLEDVPKIIQDYCDAQPTVDAVPVVHGRWLHRTEECDGSSFTGDRCSVCNYWKAIGAWNYCPNCGAKMDEVTDGKI